MVMKTIWEFYSNGGILPDPEAFKKQMWFDVELDRFNLVKHQSDETELPQAPFRHYSIGPVISLLGTNSVVDFGGCFGNAFYSIDPETRKGVRYQVLELEQLVEFATSKITDRLPFEIVSDSNLTADLLYMNSVVQYMNDDRLTRILEKFSGSYLLFDDLYLNASSSFIAKQRFYDDSIFTLIREAEGFFRLMTEAGWSKVFEQEYPGSYFGMRSPPPMQNLEMSLRVPLTRTVLFCRRTT